MCSYFGKFMLQFYGWVGLFLFNNDWFKFFSFLQIHKKRFTGQNYHLKMGQSCPTTDSFNVVIFRETKSPSIPFWSQKQKIQFKVGWVILCLHNWKQWQLPAQVDPGLQSRGRMKWSPSPARCCPPKRPTCQVVSRQWSLQDLHPFSFTS